MPKMILEKRPGYWSVWFYGVDRMPEDVELPLPYSEKAPLEMVVAHMRKRFPNVAIWYRDVAAMSTNLYETETEPAR